MSTRTRHHLYRSVCLLSILALLLNPLSPILLSPTRVSASIADEVAPAAVDLLDSQAQSDPASDEPLPELAANLPESQANQVPAAAATPRPSPTRTATRVAPTPTRTPTAPRSIQPPTVKPSVSSARPSPTPTPAKPPYYRKLRLGMQRMRGTISGIDGNRLQLDSEYGPLQLTVPPHAEIVFGNQRLSISKLQKGDRLDGQVLVERNRQVSALNLRVTRRQAASTTASPQPA